MNYYAIGDNTFCISHHGVIGMHWGIRRYQPYSIGYQRKGNHTGKELGEAKKSRAEKKAEQQEKKLSKYKEYHTRKIDSQIDKLNDAYYNKTDKYGSRWKSVAGAANRAQIRRSEKGLDSTPTNGETKRADRALRKYKEKEIEYYTKKGELEATKSALMKYTYDDMIKENRYVSGRNAVNIALFGVVGGVPLNALMSDSVRKSYRTKNISEADRRSIKENAEKKASFEAKDLVRSRNGYSSDRSRMLRRYNTRKMDKAKYKGEYDTGFEFVNKNKMDQWTEKDKQKEYKKFLKDPRNYYDNKAKEKDHANWTEYKDFVEEKRKNKK